MKEGRPSRTAAWVAACRSYGALLPKEARLADDPYGAKFIGRDGRGRVVGLGDGAPRALRFGLALAMPLLRDVMYMQVRTRVLDDAMLEFVRAGGKQIVLLGAGFDCRALRFARELAQAKVTVYEVDHPATQEKKRATLARVLDPSAPVRYLSWDFQHQGTANLPDALAALGLSVKHATLTIWEGVTMYLTEDAIVASVAAIRRMGAPGSILAFTYFDRTIMARPDARAKLVSALVARLGEPFRFGWDPGELPAWLLRHGLELVRDVSAPEAAAALLPPRFARRVRDGRRHMAIARVLEDARNC